MVLASYGFKRYQPLEALLWKARICIWKNLARKLQEKHILIDSDLDFHQQKLVFSSHTWLSYLGSSRVTVTIDSLPTMQQFTYLRMKLAWPERPSFAKLKRTNTWHKRWGDICLQHTSLNPSRCSEIWAPNNYQKQTSRLKIDTLGGPKSTFYGLIVTSSHSNLSGSIV